MCIKTSTFPRGFIYRFVSAGEGGGSVQPLLHADCSRWASANPLYKGWNYEAEKRKALAKSICKCIHLFLYLFIYLRIYLTGHLTFPGVVGVEFRLRRSIQPWRALCFTGPAGTSGRMCVGAYVPKAIRMPDAWRVPVLILFYIHSDVPVHLVSVHEKRHDVIRRGKTKVNWHRG